MIESGRARPEPASGSRFDLIEMPVAIALLDGSIVEANRAFRAWTGSDARTLEAALGVALPALTAGKPHVIKASTKTERGRTMPVEYQLRLAVHERAEVIVVEGRDLSRVHEKEAMLHAFAKTIEVNNRLLTKQHAENEQLFAEVNEAYAAVKRLLDAADQGFATLDRHGRLLASRSAAFDLWFATPPVGAPFADCVRRLNTDVAAMFELFWGQLDLDVLPLDVLLEMLPAELRAGHRWFRIAYKPALDPAGALLNLLVVISDVTDEIERERAEAEQTELANLLARYASDRAGFAQFVSEADALVATITAPSVDPLELLRATHTLKGNCGLFGAQVIAARCHELEDHVAELGEEASVATRRTLGEDWRALRRRVGAFLEHGGDGAWIARDELDDLHRRVPTMSSDQVRRALEAWTWESGNRRLTRLGAQVRELAARLERGPVDVVVDDGGLRFDPVRWNPFWTSLVHLVLNSVDHGLEPAEQRARLGKPARARVTLRTQLDGDRVQIEIADDGRGIDWEAVARAARARGLDTSSNQALACSLFVDGLSTRTEIDAQSGRGVGLAAVRAACEHIGGTIEVESKPGAGTLFRFCFPVEGVACGHDLIASGASRARG